MPGITNPAEEYFKDGMWAWDPAGAEWLKLIIDPLTNRLVIDHPGDLEVVQPTPADLCVANYGWDGSAWRKLPLVWGYSGIWDVNVGGAAPGVTYSANTAVGAAGEVWILQSAAIVLPARNPTKLYIFVTRASGAIVYLGAALAPGANVPLVVTCNVALVTGDTLTFGVDGTLAGDAVQAGLCGYKMKVAE